MADDVVKVSFVGDSSSLNKAIDDIDGKTKQAERGFSSLQTALVGIGIGAGLKAVIGQASDLNETVSKTRTIFGESSKSIEAWGNGAAQALGLSKNEALNAASTFGNMFDQLGIGSDIAAKMSTEMVGLAADFASFHNADTVEVTEAMTSAFRGEYDALQKYVPTINAAAVEQEALAMTHKSTTKELTDQDKALAVNSLMMKNAGDAAGDFSRTSDSLANKQRILSAEFKDVQAELGSKLMPIATEVVGVFTKLLDAFSALPGPLQNVVLGAGAAAGGFVLIGKAVGGLTAAKDALVPAFEKIRSVIVQTGDDGERSMTKFGKAASTSMGVVAVAAAAYMANEITKAANKIELNIDRLAGASDEQMNKIAAGMKMVQEQGAKWGEGTNLLRQSHEQFRQTAEQSIDTAMRLRDALAANGVETSAYDAILKDVTESTHRKEEADARSKDVLDQSKDSTEKKSEADKQADKELKKLVDTLMDYEKQLKDADSAIGDLMESTNGIADADADWNKSLRDLTGAVKENGTTVDVWTEAGNKNREALNGVIEAGGKWLAKIYEQEGASQSFSRTSDNIRASIVETMRQLGFGDAEIAKYTDLWNQVPAYIETNVAIKYRITTIQELMQEMDKTGFLADGGTVNTPFQIVGEQGPELVQLPMGSRVYSNSDSQRMLSGSGSGGSGGAIAGQVVNIYIGKVNAESPSSVNNMAASMSRELAVALRGSVA